MVNDVSTILSEFIYNMAFEDLTDEVIDLTKAFIIDYYSACLAGYRVNVKFNRAIEQIINASAGKGLSTVLFSGKKTDAMNAAFMNAVYSHGADIDDGNRKAMGHIATHVMSAVFALAQERKSLWKDVFVAIIAGYEVYNRISAAAQPGLVRRGFHSTGTAGAIACGAASAKLIGLSKKGIYDSMSIAAIQAAGLFVIMESGQCCKPLNPANAARVGILSATLAERGIDGPKHALESPKGWFHAMTDESHEEAIIDGLGTTFTITESYLKPYPSCRHTHCGIDAAIELRKKLDVREIESIDVFIYHNAITAVGDIRIPKSVDEAKFSLYYAIAVALIKGSFSFDDLVVEHIDDLVLKMIGKINLIEDNSMEDAYNGIRGAKMLVTTCDGKSYESFIRIPKGDATNPFAWDDVIRKLILCGRGYLSPKHCNDLVASIRGVDLYQPFEQPEMM